MLSNNITSYLKLIGIIVILSSNSLLSQNNYPLSKYCVEQAYKGNEKIVFKSEIAENLYQSIYYKGYDTLYVTTNKPDPVISFVGPDNSALLHEVTWITPLFGYVVLNSEHEFDISAYLYDWYPSYTDKYFILIGDFSFVANDTLHLSSEQAIYEVEFNPVDKDGIPFSQLSWNTTNEFFILTKHGLGYFLSGSNSYPSSNIYVSSVPDDFTIITTSEYNDMSVNNKSYFVEYPAIEEINQNIILSNDPEAYKPALFQCFVSYEYFSELEASIFTGIRVPGFYGFYNYFFSGSMIDIDYTQYWNGEINIINQAYSEANPGAMAFFSTPMGYQNTRFCMSPLIEVVNDSICAYNTVYPPYNLYKTNIGDTLKFGETPITQNISWANNNPLNRIYVALIENSGQLLELTAPVQGFPQYSIFDSIGNLILSGVGDYIVYQNPAPGIYSVKISNLKCPVYNGNGDSQVVSVFSFGAEDASPPTISPVQFRNSEGKPCIQVNVNEDLRMYFNAADFNDIAHDTNIYYWVQRVYQPVIDDSTKLYIRIHGQFEWQEAEVTNVHEDSISGITYISDLSAFTSQDSSALDIKIKIQDYNGNRSEYLISPAILIGEGIGTGIENAFLKETDLSFTVSPNPANTSINLEITTTKNSKTDLNIYSMNGKCMLKRTGIPLQTGSNTIGIELKDKSNKLFSPGIYIITLNSETHSVSSKLVVN